jgi:Skp family chaperone for outer membrane proteins
MALVVSHRPKSHVADPTAPLKQALMSFENILTEEQKKQYQASSIKPNASSVLSFVAEVDENNKGRGSRCVAPRLYTFLDAAQQFTSVVDTFVSSNPTIAALVWGGVKMAVLTASNIASYFDKVTSLIMDIGKVCPTYQQFGQLYPGCVGLQQALCEYYAIIIQVCIKIIEISRRTAMAQMWSSILNPFDNEFKAVHDDLDGAAKAVQLQISLASKQAAKETARLWELDSKENAEHRWLASKFRKDVRNEHAEAHQWRVWRAKREAEKMRSAIRMNLSTINHVKPWKRAVQQRVSDTAEWFQYEHAFRDWRGDKHTAILWCSGTMGGGKTVLVSNIVAHLHVTRNQSDTISYYFCQSDLPESLRARDILGSLARQLLETQIEHAKDDLLVNLHDNSQDLNTEDVADFLISHLEADKTYYVIIDGLDECENSDVQAISRLLSRLCGSRPKDLKILCSGRPELEKELFRIHKPGYKLNLTQRHTGPDIGRYITSTLDQCLETNQLKLSNPTLVLTIAKALQEGSDGM